MSGAQYLSGDNGAVLVGYQVQEATGSESLPTTTDGTYDVRTPILTTPVQKGDLIICRAFYDYNAVSGESFGSESVSMGFTEQVPTPTNTYRTRLALNLGSSTKTPGDSASFNDSITAEVITAIKETCVYGFGWRILGSRSGPLSFAQIDNAKVEMYHYRPLIPGELRVDQFSTNTTAFSVEDTT